MITVKKVTKAQVERIVEYLKSDIIRHVFAFYDIQHEFDRTTMHVALENKEVVGYILVYTATDVPSVILECEEEPARELVEYAPQNGFILHTQPKNVQTVIERFPNAKSYVENWMLVRRNQANTFRSQKVRKLETRSDAKLLSNLLLDRKDRPRRNLRRYQNWMTKMPLYGVFDNDQLVSYAGSFIQLPQVWMIGGVYTAPEKRNKGYALLATSAVTQEALRQAETAALFVRSDNYPAIRVYEKIGYKKIGEKTWVDVGTGLMP
jgi:RimJ/RimL family protein N-acetyltransferase